MFKNYVDKAKAIIKSDNSKEKTITESTDEKTTPKERFKKYWGRVKPSTRTDQSSSSTSLESQDLKALTKEDYIAALEKMKNSPNDRLGILSEIGITWAGATAGFVAGGAAASAVGATTLLGSSTLAGIFGGVFVTSTPVGWLIGGAVLAGGAAYGLTRLIQGSYKADQEKEKNIQALEDHIQEYESSGQKQKMEELVVLLIELLQQAVELGFSQEKSNKILVRVFNNKMPVEKAISLVTGYVENSEKHQDV